MQRYFISAFFVCQIVRYSYRPNELSTITQLISDNLEVKKTYICISFKNLNENEQENINHSTYTDGSI